MKRGLRELAAGLCCTILLAAPTQAQAASGGATLQQPSASASAAAQEKSVIPAAESEWTVIPAAESEKSVSPAAESEKSVIPAAVSARSGSLAAVSAQTSDQSGFAAVFDAEYYYNTYPDLQKAIGMNPDKLFVHYVTSGAREGRSGCADFNLRAYMQNNHDLLGVFQDDYNAYCRHFAENGRREGRNALPCQEDKTLMGSYTTSYDPQEQRAINVELAAARINGITLQSGDKFSFSASVLPRTAANGYVMGPAFAAGREVESIGGGICQVSSTLYVAMLLAGMPATERYYHSAVVEYVPVGLDATIAGTAKDLKFKNVYSHPITIKAEAKDGVLTIGLHKA